MNGEEATLTPSNAYKNAKRAKSKVVNCDIPATRPLSIDSGPGMCTTKGNVGKNESGGDSLKVHKRL